jgi:hypothetical protein
MSDLSMSPTTRFALRTTAVIAGIQAIGHAALFLSARPTHGPDEVAVISAMRSQSFNFGGFAPHTYWDMYFGYGLLAVVFAAFLATLLWILSEMTSDARSARRAIVLTALTVTVHAVIVTRYFFLVPFVFDIAVIVGLGITLLLSVRQKPLPRTAER